MVNTASVLPSPPSPIPAEQVELTHRLGLLGSQHRLDRVGCTRNKPLRAWPSESDAPALTSDSVTFLLHAPMSILCG